MNNALLAPYSSLILASIQCLPVNDGAKGTIESLRIMTLSSKKITEDNMA